MSKERPNILLVEDDPDQAALMRRWFSLSDMEVTHTADAGEGMRLAREPEFDFVVADLMLADASGLEVIGQSKLAHPWRPAVLVTAYSDEEYANEVVMHSALRRQADTLFTKPLSGDVLVERIRDLMTSARAATPTLRAPAPATKRTVLAIGAHPDDVEIGCGGALERSRAVGDRVVILTLSHGGAGGNANERAREANTAARLLGAELVLGDLDDTRMACSPETIGLIEAVIARYQPQVVYTHSAHDNHQDHRAAHAATVVAARRVPRLLAYQSPSTTIEFRPNHFVDIEEHLEAKIRLIQAYGTQTAKCPYLEPALVRATARYWGRLAGFGTVEPLEVLRAVE